MGPHITTGQDSAVLESISIEATSKIEVADEKSHVIVFKTTTATIELTMDTQEECEAWQRALEAATGIAVSYSKKKKPMVSTTSQEIRRVLRKADGQDPVSKKHKGSKYARMYYKSDCVNKEALLAEFSASVEIEEVTEGSSQYHCKCLRRFCASLALILGQ